MPSRIPPEPWHAFLSDLDLAMPAQVKLHCLGGFVVTQFYGLQRPTIDIDVMAIDPKSQLESVALAMRGGELHHKHGVYTHYVHMYAYPENYDERLVEAFVGVYKRLRLYVLDPYDLALTKLERNLERDFDDVKFLARTIPFDLDLLRKRYQDEMRIYLGRPEREDLTLQLWIDAIEEERNK